jgi:uncharacterized Zn-binding protein involved in type VI secretion
MPAAARVTDVSTHGGVVIGPGVLTVLIGGLPAAVLGDMHGCAIPTHPPTPIVRGSTSVLIGGIPAARAGDSTGCSAAVAIGVPTVIIGG